MTVKGFTSSIISDFKKFTVNKDEQEEVPMPLDELKTQIERISEIIDTCREVVRLKEEKQNEVS
jgi:hypothetical protein